MKIAAWARRHARSILFLVFLLAGAGAASTLVLPVGLFPQVYFPRVRVNLDAGDRPAERTGIEVTYPVEGAVRAIPGVRRVRSTSSRGSSEVTLDFDWGTDMLSATLQVESQVNKMLPSLPAGTSFEVRRMDPTVFPVIAYSLTSDSRPLTELRDLAMYQLRPALATVTGVATVGVQGGAVEEYRVVVDPAKLLALNLALSDVAAKLSASNVLTAVGRLEDHDKLYLVVSDTRFQALEQIGQTVLRSGPNGVVKVSDVATVRKDVVPQYQRVTADGRDAVLLNIYQQPGGNTVQIARDIKARLESEQKALPDDVRKAIRVANWYDQSDLIVASEASVRDAILIGVGLAALVLLLFLRNLKITLIAVLTVPTVLAATILVLFALKLSFNIMTLGGMAAAVGLIIDDAIVMTEHIIRRLRGGAARPGHGAEADPAPYAGPSAPAAPESPGQRVVRATGEFTRPLAGSSLSTIVIHIPPAFLIGVSGAFFGALSLTMASSLVISFAVAWLAIPILASLWLGPKDAREERPGPVGRGTARAYRAVMRFVLRFPWLVLLLVVPLGIFGYVAYHRVPSGFLPAMDEGGFIIDYNAPPGTSVTETDRLLRQVEAILRKNPAVQTYSRRTGSGLGGDINEANQGDFFVRLKAEGREPIDAVMEDVRKEIEHSVPGLKIETAQLMEDLIGDLTGAPQPIEVKLFAADQQALLALAPKIADAIGTVEGVVEVKNGIVPAGDALDIEVDRVKAALEGVDPDAVTKLLNDALGGSVTTSIQRGPKVVGVRVWTPRATRATDRDVRDLLLHAPNGHTFPLKRVAKLTPLTGQPQITREDLRPMIAVTGRIENRDLGSTARDVQKLLDESHLIPPGVTYQLGGLYAQKVQSDRGMLLVSVAAALLVFLLLLFLYERFRVSIAVLLTTLLAVAAVMLGLWLTKTELNITAQMGLVMIVGNVTEVAIFFYSEYAEMPAAEPARERLIAAGTQRARAVLMTTLAAILALAPLAMGVGQGAAMLRPLAIAIIAGLAVQLPLVLLVLPALLVLFRSAK